jgi:replicative DNA helicase
MNATKKTSPIKQGYHADFMDSAAFANANFQHAWLIENILVKNQPCVIGGGKKTLKTAIAIDMAISLGTGKPFLGKFKVPKKMRVALLSGESGEANIKQAARKICEAKQIGLEQCNVHWSFHLPCFSREADMNRLASELRDNDVKVVIFEPFYLCLLECGTNLTASNLFEIGPLLQRMGRACLSAGATPILVHHTNKGAATRNTHMILDDLAFAAIGEYARQWLLINRRKPFDPGAGTHELLIAAGGSAGHSGCWQVDIHEGRLRNDFSGKEWSVTVHQPSVGGGGVKSASALYDRGDRV